MILASERLNIQHYTPDHFADFNAILMNDTIMKGIRGKGYCAPVAKEKFEAVLLDNSRYDNLGFFHVSKKDTAELVGFAKLILMDDGNLEVGYALLEELWGYGLTSEITNILVQHGLKNYPSKEIIGIVNVENKASAHVLTKQGFELRRTDFLDDYKVAYYYFSK